MSLQNEYKKLMENHEKTPEGYDNEFRSWLDPETGELIPGILLPQAYFDENIEKFKNKEKQVVWSTASAQLKNSIKSLGEGDGFFFFKHSGFLEQINYDYATGFRFLYISTFSNYGQGILCDRATKYRACKIWTRKDIENALLMSHARSARESVQKMFDYGLLKETEDGIAVNQNYCIKGNLSFAVPSTVTRTFIYGLRTIYKKSTSKEHKRLGRIVELLQFVHIETNILCWNPSVISKDDIKPLSIGDIAEILGYERKRQSYVVSSLVKNEVGGTWLLGYYIDGDKDLFVLNPYVFYQGSDPKEIQWLKTVFSIGSGNRPDISK